MTYTDLAPTPNIPPYKTHFPFGGSTAERTEHCPSWRSLADQVPPPPPSDFAREGTMLHEAMEKIINTECDPAELKNFQFDGYAMTPELYAQKFLPAYYATEDLLNAFKIDAIVTEPLVQYDDDIGGSIDLLGFTDTGDTAMLIDYKFGHVSVGADTSQLKFYAWVASNDAKYGKLFTNVNTIICAIVQPNDDGDIVETVEYTPAEIKDYGKKFLRAYDMAQAGNRTPVAGKWCRYCPAHAICPLKTGIAQSTQRLDPTLVENLSKSLEIIPQIEDWIKAVQKLAHEQLESGVPIKGYKLVNKRASRVWVNEDVLKGHIKSMRKIKEVEAYEHKFKSPAQMEKLFKEKGLDPNLLSDYITSVSSGTTIAPESDKRPDAAPTLALKALADRLA